MGEEKGLDEQKLDNLENGLFEEFSNTKEYKKEYISDKNNISNEFYDIIKDHLNHPYIEGITKSNYLTILDNLYKKFNKLHSTQDPQLYLF
jgi:hypothetical protein